MRYYPTDLLLAIEHAERELANGVESQAGSLLRDEGLSALAGLFRTEVLTEALDGLFDGLSQYPWQPLIDTNDVCEFRPVGVVVLDDGRAGNTLRGLLLSWATGNQVVIRTGRPAFWTELVAWLRGPGFPLPPARVVTEWEPGSDDTVVVVPDLELVLPDAPVGYRPDPSLFAEAGSTGYALRVRVERVGDEAAVLDAVVRMDCRSAWVQQLFHRDYLMGTRLAVARTRDAAQETERLDARLRYLVQRARHTAYYRDLTAVDGLAGLAKLPILDKEALEAHSLPASRDLRSDAAPSGQVLRSGATAGRPRYINYSRADWSNMVREAIPLFYSLGLERGDRLVNTLYGGGLYGGLITTVCEFTQMPLESYTFGQSITAEDVVTLRNSFSANSILGVPALLLPVLREAKTLDPDLRFEKIIYGATPMSESDKEWLREELGVQVISSILAANDGAQLGYQCGQLGGTLHHICPDYNLIEVVNDDGVPVPEGAAGHLLITSLQKFEGPLIRYRIGDYGRIFDHDCACGTSGKVLEYLGRSDGLIRFRGAGHILYSDVLAALTGFRVSQLQIELSSRGTTEVMVIRTEAPVTLDPSEVREALRGRFEALGDEAGGNSRPFDLLVECHPEGGLPRNTVSGKIKTVIDRRLGHK